MPIVRTDLEENGCHASLRSEEGIQKTLNVLLPYLVFLESLVVLNLDPYERSVKTKFKMIALKQKLQCIS